MHASLLLDMNFHDIRYSFLQFDQMKQGCHFAINLLELQMFESTCWEVTQRHLKKSFEVVDVLELEDVSRSPEKS